MRIAILIDERKKDNQQVLSIADKLHRQFTVVEPPEAEILIVIGGDGFMTDIVKKYCHLKIPFYGINRGTFGYLLNDHGDDGDFSEAITKAKVTEFPLLQACFYFQNGLEDARFAFNDVFTKTTSAQAAKHRMTINGFALFDTEPYIGDGLLVCTPGGSTAYNRAAGGLILDHSSTSLGLTPLAPFLPRDFKPQAIPGDSIIEIELLEDDKRKHLVVADNQTFEKVTRVTICKSSETAKLAFRPDKSYFWKTRIERFPWLKQPQET